MADQFMTSDEIGVFNGLPSSVLGGDTFSTRFARNTENMRRSIFDLPAPHLYLATQIANNAKSRQVGLEEFMPELKSGISPEDIKIEEDKYDAMQQAIQDELQNQPQIPQPTNPNMNIAQGISGLLGAVLDPSNAAQNVGVALQGPIQEAGRQDQLNVAKYQADIKQRDDLINYLESRADEQGKRVAQAKKMQWEQEQFLRGEQLDRQKLEEQTRLREATQAQTIANQKDIAISRARDDLQQKINQHLIQFGTIDETNAQGILDYREGLKQRYGLADNELPPIPVGKSPKLVEAEQRMAIAKQNFEWAKQDRATRMKILDAQLAGLLTANEIKSLNKEKLLAGKEYWGKDAQTAYLYHRALLKRAQTLAKKPASSAMNESLAKKLDTSILSLQKQLTEAEQDSMYWSQGIDGSLVDSSGMPVSPEYALQQTNEAARRVRDFSDAIEQAQASRDELLNAGEVEIPPMAGNSIERILPPPKNRPKANMPPKPPIQGSIDGHSFKLH